MDRGDYSSWSFFFNTSMKSSSYKIQIYVVTRVMQPCNMNLLYLQYSELTTCKQYQLVL